MYHHDMGYQRRERSVIPYIALAALVLLAAFFVYKGGRRRAVSGIGEPVQTEEKGHIDRTMDGWKLSIDYDYAYDIEALVIHTKDYPETSLGGKLAPRDLALAWGSVAAYNEVIDFHWRQSNRWYYWSASSYEEIAPVALKGIDATTSVSLQSSNNHIVPADSSVKRTIKKIRRGDHVHLKGYLVNINGSTADGKIYYWNSSTTRADTGGGSCEVFYVTSAEILP
ncbi:MAG: hypothetical protein J6X66_10600 [Lachnospiraceae bacterium]|nr:hypothetical protein [Lachnospiraceae bacterium]